MSVPHILVANVFFAPLSYGGATVVAEEVAKRLVQSGSFRVTAVSLCMRHDLEAYGVVKCHKDGIDSYLINVPTDRSYGATYDNAEVTARLSELIHAIEPDLVHAHCIQEMGTGLVTVADAARIPVILSVHDFWWLCERQFMIGADGRYCGQSPIRIERCKGCANNYWAAKARFEHLQQISAKAAFVTYPSRFAKELCEASGMAPGRGMVWENGVSLPGSGFFEEQARRRQRDPRVTFGYVGGPSHIKGWPTVRAAFSGLERQDLRGLVVDGSRDGSWWKGVSLDRLKGDWSVHPRYAQNQMDSFYAEIDVLLFMSQWKETFGLAIREALARGITVIQTDSGGTVEHDGIGRTPLLPIGASPGALRDTVNQVLDQEVRGQAPLHVRSFDDQAHAFAELAHATLARGQKAA